MKTLPNSKTNAATALAAFLFLCALACVSISLVQPPRAVPESAPPAEFSSARAMRHVREMARAPHPTGSLECERGRRYILDELGALGVSAEVQDASSVPATARPGRPLMAARVRNIVARVPGTANAGKALMLAAHYDSVPTGPGASDDGAGVAALLETLRALKSGPPLKDDLILLITDGEELGLLGARAFAEGHAWMKDVGLVLNFEARGAGGPSMMFETSEGNGALIREMAAAAPYPVASSLMYAVYKRLPNDTDMTVFKGAGAAGLNFAYADRITSYHTALDSADVLDERSLQHHGSYALALARRFGDLDLRDLSSPDAIYFNAFGTIFLHYTESWVVPLAALVFLLFVGVMFAGLRQGLLSARGIAAGSASFLVASVVAVLLTAGVWRVARVLHAGYTVLPWRTPYEKWPYEIGFVLLALAAFALVYARLFRGTSAANLAAGALLWWLVLLLLTTALLPLGSFVFAWPLLFALLGFAFVVARGGGSFESGKGLAITTLSAIPGVVMLAPLVYMFFMMLGLELCGPFMLMVVLLAGLLVPHFRVLVARRRWLVPAVAALAGLGFVVVGLMLAGSDARQRKTNSMLYFLDADSARAEWVSTDASPDEWTSQFIGAGATNESLEAIFPWSKQTDRKADAPAAALAPPDVQVLDDRTEGDVRTLRLRLTSPRHAPVLIFYADAGADIRRATIDGKSLLGDAEGAGEVQTNADAGQQRVLRVSFSAPPPEGLELLLETGAAARLRLSVEDLSFGLPEITGQTFRPRGSDMMPAPSYFTSNTTLVKKTFGFEPAARR
ncbi:MAG: hypothetical protein QOC61_881 [Acidobacteriota bacterium]|nr:hypothetical protein [Acidobacteriota bacterium]